MIMSQVAVFGEAGAAQYVQHVTAGPHKLLADEPQERDGGDAGPAPFDYLLAALGSCTSITLRMYADRKGLNLGNVSVKLQYIRESKELARITREVAVSASITEEQRARLADIIERTPVTLAIKQGVVIASQVLAGQPA
jgi:putative redox protein